MQVTICDKCNRHCDENRWTLTIQGSTPTTREADLCASCVFALASFLPDCMHVGLPTKERVELFERKFITTKE